MQEAARRLALQVAARDSLDRLGTPVGAHVREELGGAGEQVAEEHGDAVERVVFGGDDVGLADAVPVEGAVQDRLHEIAVGHMVGPLALSLKAGGDGVAAQRLFSVPEFGQARVAHHQVAGDERHLHRDLPVEVLLLAAALFLGGIVVLSFRTVLFHPGQRFFELVRVVDPFLGPADELDHVDDLYPHSQVVLEHRLVDDRPGDPHRYPAHRQVGLAAHGGHRQPGAGELQQLFLRVRRDLGLSGVLHVAAVDAESR